MRPRNPTCGTPMLSAGVLLLVLGLLAMAPRSTHASAQTITTCEAIGCGGRYFLCGSYSWGGPNPGSRDCYTNLLPGQGN